MLCRLPSFFFSCDCWRCGSQQVCKWLGGAAVAAVAGQLASGRHSYSAVAWLAISVVQIVRSITVPRE